MGMIDILVYPQLLSATNEKTTQAKQEPQTSQQNLRCVQTWFAVRGLA